MDRDGNQAVRFWWHCCSYQVHVLGQKTEWIFLCWVKKLNDFFVAWSKHRACVAHTLWVAAPNQNFICSLGDPVLFAQ